MDAKLSTILSGYQGKTAELIPILQQVQGEFGYLREQDMVDVARFTGVSESRVYGVASFYAQFRFAPVGENTITVCRGTACYVRGAQQVLDEVSRHLGIEEGETTTDGKYSLETVACIGCCALAPCIAVNDKVEAKMTSKKVEGIFASGGKHEL